MFSHVKAIEVFIWGRHVGTLAPANGFRSRFVYDRNFLASDIELATFELPLRSGEYDDLLAVAERYAIGTAPSILRQKHDIFR